MTTPDAPREVGEPTRTLPQRRVGAPKPGEKRRRYLRWKRLATAATLLALVVFAIAAVSFVGSRTEDEGIRATEALLDDLGRAIDAHFRRVGELPRANLGELSHPSSPYKGAVPPEDAYGALIEYEVIDPAAGTFRLRSFGADGRRSTDDDITWPPR